MSDVSDLLNAYLDGELHDDERASVESALRESPDLELELVELSATRSMLRGLGPVEPHRPLTLGTQPGRDRSGGARRGGRLAIAVAGVAAVWLLVLSVGVSLGSLPLVPQVDQLALQHASADTIDFQPMTIDQMADDPAVLDDIGLGMRREAIFQRGELVQVRYSDGEHTVSIFHQRGEIAWDEMPESGNVAVMPDGPIWTSTMDGFDVLVTQRGDLVVTVVADGDMDNEMTMAASKMVPEVDMDRGLWSRLMDAPGNIVDRF